MKLLYYNPETEYALASGASFYTPPAVVEKMRRANQLLPEKWAEPDDIILVDDVKELKSDFRIVDWSMLGNLFERKPDIEIEPWGWNKALVRKFLDHGVPVNFLPDEAFINLIRSLAHRRSTIALNEEWNERVGADYHVDVPVEIKRGEECLAFLERNPGCWFKAPWSSSGRGVINTAADMAREQVRQWCHGIIRRQGSVVAETGAKRIADFATEWRVKDGEASYLGLSCFNTSNRGKYLSNDSSSQSELAAKFNQLSHLSLKKVVEIQKKIIEEIYVGYSGLMGIDMMIEADAKIRPFVEVNMRRTMGMIYI